MICIIIFNIITPYLLGEPNEPDAAHSTTGQVVDEAIVVADVVVGVADGNGVVAVASVRCADQDRQDLASIAVATFDANLKSHLDAVEGCSAVADHCAVGVTAATCVGFVYCVHPKYIHQHILQSRRVSYQLPDVVVDVPIAARC